MPRQMKFGICPFPQVIGFLKMRNAPLQLLNRRSFKNMEVPSGKGPQKCLIW